MEEKSGDTNKKAENLVQNILLAKIEQPKALFEELLNIQLEDYKVLYRCVYDLNHNHNVDFCVLGVQAINDGLSCMEVRATLEFVIPDLNHKVDSIIQLLETFHLNNQSLPIEELARKQPDLARHLLDKLLADSTSFSVDYISAIFCTLAELNTKEIHAELLSLTNNDSVYVVQAVINALGRLDYQIPSDQKELEKSIQVLNKLSKKKKSENIDLAIVHAYGYLVNISEQAQERLVTYSKQDNPQIHYQIANTLFRNCKEFNQRQWFKDCLFQLARTSCLQKDTIKRLDIILLGILQEDQDWNYVEDFLLEWSLKSDIHESPKEDTSKLFNSSFSLFIKKKDNLERLVTNFLNHDDHRVHHVLSHLIHTLSVSEIKDLNLNTAILNSLEFVDILYISRKILGYIINHNILCSLIFSILKKENIDNQIQNLVLSTLSLFVGRDYPGTTIEFLKQRNSNENRKEIKDIISVIIINIEEYQNKRKELPTLKELLPSKQQSYQIAIEQSKKMNELSEQAQNESILMQIATHIPLKYGKSCFSYNQGGYSTPWPLKSISHSAELPISEITHPVSKEIERAGYRVVKRGER